jgi:hypothetical protein
MDPILHMEHTLDRLAAQLAELSGVVWSELLKYPGYERNYWRHQAEQILNGAPIRDLTRH